MKWSKPKNYKQLQNDNGLDLRFIRYNNDFSEASIMLVDKEYKTFVDAHMFIMQFADYKNKLYKTMKREDIIK